MRYRMHLRFSLPSRQERERVSCWDPNRRYWTGKIFRVGQVERDGTFGGLETFGRRHRAECTIWSCDGADLCGAEPCVEDRKSVQECLFRGCLVYAGTRVWGSVGRGHVLPRAQAAGLAWSGDGCIGLPEASPLCRTSRRCVPRVAGRSFLAPAQPISNARVESCTVERNEDYLFRIQILGISCRNAALKLPTLCWPSIPTRRTPVSGDHNGLVS
jgi:hypothetical protein